MENGITTMVHEMEMNGHHLVEKIQRNFEDYELYGYVYPTQFIHSQSADDISYTVSKSRTEGIEGNDEPLRVVTTQMTQEEVEKFEEDWINLWKPEIDTTFFWCPLFLTEK